MDEYQEYLRLFGDLPFGMRPKFEDYQKQVSAQTARDTLTQGIAEGDLDKAYKEIFASKNLYENLSKINGEYKENELVTEVIKFIEKDKKRPICAPQN